MKSTSLAKLSIIAILFSHSLYAQYTQVGNKLKATDYSGTSSIQGRSVSLSADGSTMAVGGPGDNTGVGAVWIYTASGGNWSRAGGKLVGTGGTGLATEQGASVSLSADGKTLAVGGYGDNSGIGAVWVFTQSGGNWSQMGNKLVGTGYLGSTPYHVYQGSSVHLSSDGKTLAVGGYGDNNYTGAVWMYTLSGSNWGQKGNKLVGTGGIGSTYQGSSVRLSSDGITLAVGGYGDNNYIGAVWIYTFSGSNWSQMGNKLVGTGGVGSTYQGGSTSLSSDGKTLAVGGNSDNSGRGAVWVYTLSGSNWSQIGNKLVGAGGVGTPYQGSSICLSSDGKTLAVGGSVDNSYIGAAWVYTLSGSNWVQVGNKLAGTGGVGSPELGTSVSLSSDGKILAIGAQGDDSNIGAIWVFANSNGNVTETVDQTIVEPNGLIIFPNPSRQSFSIKYREDMPYTITDIQGHLTEIGNTSNPSIGSHLSTGIYQLTVDGKVVKIVKLEE